MFGEVKKGKVNYRLQRLGSKHVPLPRFSVRVRHFRSLASLSLDYVKAQLSCARLCHSQNQRDAVRGRRTGRKIFHAVLVLHQTHEDSPIFIEQKCLSEDSSI